MIEAKVIQKYRGRSLSGLIDTAQKLVNNYVRKRDAINSAGDFVCISCGKMKPKNQCNAGHFFSRGNYPIVRFDLDNVHSQCIQCNMYLSANLYDYQKNLIKKIGKDRFEELEMLAHLKGFKYDRIMVIDLIERFKKL